MFEVWEKAWGSTISPPHSSHPKEKLQLVVSAGVAVESMLREAVQYRQSKSHLYSPSIPPDPASLPPFSPWTGQTPIIVLQLMPHLFFASKCVVVRFFVQVLRYVRCPFAIASLTIVGPSSQIVVIMPGNIT